jgi:hypothetical protein
VCVLKIDLVHGGYGGEGGCQEGLLAREDESKMERWGSNARWWDGEIGRDRQVEVERAEEGEEEIGRRREGETK